MSTERKLICRKCGDNHLTLRCNKNKNTTSLSNKVDESKSTTSLSNKVDESKSTTSLSNKVVKWNKQDTLQKRPNFRTTYKVKLSELPINMTEEELMELTTDWGHITKIRLNAYEESSTAYIEFGYEEEANYFVKALDKTPFEYLLLSASRAY